MDDDTTFAVIADIHGNILALDAVLDDIRLRGVEHMLNLGDCVYGPVEPRLTIERLIELRITTVSGNMDRMIIEPDVEAPPGSTMQLVRDSLTFEQKAWLTSLPDGYRRLEVFACHGTPDSDETSLLEDITPHGVFLADVETISAALKQISESVILCGHTHQPRTVWLPDGRLVVNPGSVGMPAYDHNVPYPHKMEAGSPHARYAILSSVSGRWTVAQIAVAYDWESAALTAEKNGRADYAHYIRTGRGGYA